MHVLPIIHGPFLCLLAQLPPKCGPFKTTDPWPFLLALHLSLVRFTPICFSESSLHSRVLLYPNTHFGLLSLPGCQGLLSRILSRFPSPPHRASQVSMWPRASTSAFSTSGPGVASSLLTLKKATDASHFLPCPFPKCPSPVIAPGFT